MYRKYSANRWRQMLSSLWLEYSGELWNFVVGDGAEGVGGRHCKALKIRVRSLELFCH